MKSIVIYYSESGNTEKVAKAIAEILNADIKRAENTNPSELTDYDLIFIGTPVHGARPAKKIEKFLDGLPFLNGKKGAAFCTIHSMGDKRTLDIIKGKLERKGIAYIGGFSCRGLSRLIANFGPRIFNRGRPNDEDLKNAAEFAKNVLEIAKK